MQNAECNVLHSTTVETAVPASRSTRPPPENTALHSPRPPRPPNPARPTQPAAAADCSAGCSLSGESGVCGANGLTFVNECLAACAGTSVAYSGACRAPGAVAAASVGRAAASFDKHPIGQFMTFGSAAAAAAPARGAPFSAATVPARVATASDIGRFADEGFALVGPARLGSFKVGKPEHSPNGAVTTAAKGDSGEAAVFTVRVMPEEGLVYVSSKPVVPASASDATAGYAAAIAPSVDAVVSAAALSPAAQHAVVRVNATAVTQARARVRAVGRKLRAPGWEEVTELLGYPFKAIGWLNIGFAQGSGSCSGSMVAPHAVVTAAVSDPSMLCLLSPYLL
jgi:hypothetical protein